MSSGHGCRRSCSSYCAQPWFPEALANAQERKALEIPYEIELERELAFFEAELLVVKTDGQREDTQSAIDALRSDIARRKS